MHGLTMLSNHNACLRFNYTLICDAVELVTCNFKIRCLLHSESHVACNFSFINYSLALEMAFFKEFDASREQNYFFLRLIIFDNVQMAIY
jgi:hypothetical protein